MTTRRMSRSAELSRLAVYTSGVFLTLLYVGCAAPKAETDAVAEDVLRVLRERPSFSDLSVSDLQVQRITDYDPVLTARLYEVETPSIRPRYYFYATRKGASTFLLTNEVDSGSSPRSLVNFVNFNSLARTADMMPLALAHLRVLSGNRPDTIISKLGDIPGLESHVNENGGFVVTSTGERVSLKKLKAEPPKFQRDTLGAVENLTITFNSFSKYTGSLYLNRISLNKNATYSVARELICDRIVHGQLID